VTGAGSRQARNSLPSLLCGLLLALFVFQLGLHALRAGATTDEPLHLLAGHRYLACGDFAFNPEHPPLLKELAAVPLQGMDVRMPDVLPCNPGFIGKTDAFRLGAAFLQRNGQDRLLIPARAMAGLFGVALALLVWVAAWRMFGAWPAVAAMALLAMEPVLVAHGALVTTDMAIAATSFLAMLVLYASRPWRPMPRVLALGGAFGLMLASKHSALLMLPLLAMLRLLDASVFRDGPGRAGPQLLRPLAELCAAGGLALLVLWAFYGFRYSATPGASATVDLAGFIDAVGKPGARKLALAQLLPWIAATRLFPEAYLMGLTDIVGTSVRYTRVLGQVYSQGQWFFYPVAFTVKSSLPLLLLLPVGLAALCLQPARRRQLLFLLLPPAGYLAIAMSSKFSDGIRHILQVYPYCLLLAGFGLSALWRRGNAWRVALACLLAWQGAVVVRTAPDYIPFANAFWGGPTRAYGALPYDSAEWGQSLKRIRTYIVRNKVARCWIAGVDDPLLFADVRPCRRLPEGRIWRAGKGGMEAIPRRIDGVVFLGVRMDPAREGDTYRPLLERRPRMLADAVFVSEGTFDVAGAAALGHAIAADGNVQSGRLAEAVREGAIAVELDAGDPRAWISYGDALLAAGQLGQARQAHARAERALARNPDYGFLAAGRLAGLRQRLEQPR